MTLDSKYFDRIRVRPAETVAAEAPACEWQGCRAPGGYRAPKGRLREGEYFNFCLDHVRHYNKSYNYFAGMADDDVAAYQKASATGHRPTWSMGARDWDHNREAQSHRNDYWSGTMHDTFGIFGGGFQRRRAAEEEPRRTLKNQERRSFEALNLEGAESGEEIKARYKSLVKRFHPDANGGDRSLEDKLREIIQAYNYLKSAGFC
jgi:curved DNA-binding protein CbpA